MSRTGLSPSTETSTRLALRVLGCLEVARLAVEASALWEQVATWKVFTEDRIEGRRGQELQWTRLLRQPTCDQNPRGVARLCQEWRGKRRMDLLTGTASSLWWIMVEFACGYTILSGTAGLCSVWDSRHDASSELRPLVDQAHSFAAWRHHQVSMSSCKRQT